MKHIEKLLFVMLALSYGSESNSDDNSDTNSYTLYSQARAAFYTDTPSKDWTTNITEWNRVYSSPERLNLTCESTENPEEANELSFSSWFGGWLRWCPTSLSMLRDAEKKVLTNLRTSYRGHYVNSGCTVGTEESHIWTISMNEDSKNTPLVLIHGFGAGVGLWILNLDSLAANRPVYAFDVVGFGRSSRPPFTPDPLETEREFITTIEEWRKALSLDKFIILGHSFGGFLAASYAIKYPDRVSHLVLADPWGFPERPLDVAERYNLPIWVKALAAILQPFNPLLIVRTAGPLGPSLLKRVRPDLARKFSSIVKDAEDVIPNYLYQCNAQKPSGEAAFHAIQSGYGWARYPMIHRMDSLRKGVPITLIYGSRSWVDRDPGFHIKYNRPDSYVDVQVIQGAGHHVYADRAEDFNAIVNKLGTYIDSGTLPILPPIDFNEHRSEKNVMTIKNMLNVGSDNAKDDDSKDENTK